MRDAKVGRDVSCSSQDACGPRTSTESAYRLILFYMKNFTNIMLDS